MGRPRIVKKFSKYVDAKQGQIGGNASDYHSTYVEHKNFVPVKNVKPPPTPPPPRHPAMMVETTAMNSYIPKDVTNKREMIIPVEKHEVSDEPLSNSTVYRKEFISKTPLPAIQTRPRTNAEGRAVSQNVKFDGRTTNKQYYQEWEHQNLQRFGELPCYSNTMIYPDKQVLAGDKEMFVSRTHTDFPYKTIPKPEMVKVAEGNIKVGEGVHNHKTTHRSAYQFVPGEGKASTNMRPSRASKILALKRMQLQSKYQSDFPHMDKYPSPPKPVTPAPDTLEIKMTKNLPFMTEQRNQYHGWDVKKHKRPLLSKLEDNTEISTDPMQTNTTMMRDFPPKEAVRMIIDQADRPHTNRAEKKGKFHGVTTNKTYFQDWGAHTRPRFGDFHEGYKKILLPDSLKPSQEFTTTTKSIFVEKYARPRTCMKPPNATIDTSQSHDFNTVSMSCYKNPPDSAYEIEDVFVKC